MCGLGRGVNWEVRCDVHTLSQVRSIVLGGRSPAQGPHLGTLWGPRGWDGGVGRGDQKGGTCVYTWGIHTIQQ